MRVPFLTRLLEIKEAQLKIEAEQLKEIKSMEILVYHIHRMLETLTKSKRRCKNGK